MSKETRLNIRITPEFQEELKSIAAYHGLTVSSYVHSTLVRKIREERETTPEAFKFKEPAKVVATLAPGSIEEAREIYAKNVEALTKAASTPAKMAEFDRLGKTDGKKKRKTG